MCTQARRTIHERSIRRREIHDIELLVHHRDLAVVSRHCEEAPSHMSTWRNRLNQSHDRTDRIIVRAIWIENLIVLNNAKVVGVMC